MDWFLYHNRLRQDRVKLELSFYYLKKSLMEIPVTLGLEDGFARTYTYQRHEEKVFKIDMKKNV